MGELSTTDVTQYTKGRLVATDAETIRLLAAAVQAARKYCGWSVTPRQTVTVTVDGPGTRLLALPTMNLVSLASVVEDGVALDVSSLHWSPLGLVRKSGLSGVRWSGNYGAIVVTMTHGFDVADDFNAAVLALVDRMSLTVGTGTGVGANLVEKRIGDVTYRWQETELVGLLDDSLLGPYRLSGLA